MKPEKCSNCGKICDATYVDVPTNKLLVMNTDGISAVKAPLCELCLVLYNESFKGEGNRMNGP